MLQTRILRKKDYQNLNIDETEYSSIVWERKEKLDKMAFLLSEGNEEIVALKVLDMTRATYYRWKKNYALFGLEGLEDASRRPNQVRQVQYTSQIEQRIYFLRKKFRIWGKAKIATRYKAEYGDTIPISTVGRIITKLIKQGRIMPVRFYLHGKKDVKKRNFNSHAQRWTAGLKATQPGELIQVDHMTTRVAGFGEIKHFNAVCPVTKYAVYQVYTEANSRNAADFLEHMKKEFPFPIRSMQVDGGSEFMGDFEKTAAASNIPLYVLPPRSPEFNGGVERGNGTAKYEFYAQYDAQPSLHMIRKNLQKFASFYNRIRPHQGIGLLTPSQFYESIRNREAQSHM